MSTYARINHKWAVSKMVSKDMATFAIHDGKTYYYEEAVARTNRSGMYDVLPWSVHDLEYCAAKYNFRIVGEPDSIVLYKSHAYKQRRVEYVDIVTCSRSDLFKPPEFRTLPATIYHAIPLRDDFCPRGLEECIIKKKINKRFARLLKTCGASLTTNIVVLDGQECYTSNRLRKHFTDITVVNPLLSLAEQARVRHYRMHLFEFLRDFEFEETTSAHFALDYCGEYYGSMRVKPRVDLRLLFAKGMLLRENGVLWLTASMRRLTSEARSTHLDDVAEDVISMARESGYDLKVVRAERYRKGGMAYWFFKSS